MTYLHADSGTWRTDLDDELHAIGEVADRLAARFPVLPRGRIEQTVYAEYAALDGAVRDYVPILVERRARNRLRARGDAACR